MKVLRLYPGSTLLSMDNIAGRIGDNLFYKILFMNPLKMSMIRKYHNHTPQVTHGTVRKSHRTSTVTIHQEDND